MYLKTDSDNFIPKDFVILNFYGKNVCFAWKNKEFVCFQYKYENTTDELKVYEAPLEIKDVRHFGGRLFLLYYPNGIYKMTENLEFAFLSEVGIELGSDFSEVLAPDNGFLVLKDKKFKRAKNLLSFSPTSNVFSLALNHPDTDKSLRKALADDADVDENFKLCIISCDANLYKMSGQTIQKIYTCDCSIMTIKPVKRDERIIGAVLQTDENFVIFMHIAKSKLKYKKIHLETAVKMIAGFVDMQGDLLLIHSNGQLTYYTRIILSENPVQETRIEDKCYASFRFYQSQYIIYLTNNAELIQIPIDYIKMIYDNKPDYIKLEPNMLKGLEKIIENICEKSVELNKLREKLDQEEDMLKRINLFVTKQHIRYCPKESVARFADQIFLVSSFENVLPKNSVLVKMLKSRGKSIFSMKHVKSCDTIVEMPIRLPSLSCKLYTTTDLISYKNDDNIWCLVKNYVRDPVHCRSKIKLFQEKSTFINCKLVVLQNLIKNNSISMDNLQKLKNQIRSEIHLDHRQIYF